MRIGSVLRVLVPACLAALALHAGAALAAVTQWPQATSDLKPDPAVTYGQLPNGMRYAIRRGDRPEGLVSVRLVIEAGSMQEAHDQEGLAHLIEHMAFRGSAHVADGEIMKTLQRFGAQLGADANAHTTETETSYLFNLPAAEGASVDTVLGFLRDIGGELSFSQAALDTERKVVLAEGRQRADPGQDIFAAQLAAEFPGHPYDRLPIGRVEVVEGATPAQLRAFYDAYYRPERAVLVVTGAVDPAAIEAKIKAVFSDWRGRGPAGQDPPAYAPSGRPRTIVTIASAGAPDTALSVVWIPPYAAPDWTRAGRIEANIRAIGEAALSRRIFDMDRQAGSPFGSGGAGQFLLTGVARGENLGAHGVVDLPKTIHVLTQARRQVMDEGLTQAEIDLAVAFRREALQRQVGLDPPTQALAAMIAGDATSGALDLSPQQQLDLFEEAAKGLTADRVNRTLRAQFAGEGPIVALVSADPPPTDKAGLGAMLASADAAPATPFQAPKPAVWTHVSFGAPGTVVERREAADLGVTMVRFANGVRLTVKPLQTSPGQVAVVARFGHGRLDLPRDRLDSSDWSMILLQMGGLDDLRADEIHTALVGHPVLMGASTADDAFTVSSEAPLTRGTVPVADLDLELQDLTATITAPGWRPDFWKTVMTMTEQQYRASAATAGQVYDMNFRSLLHPGDQRWIVDTPQLLETFTPAAARAFIEPILKNADLEVLVVGDVTADQAIAAVAKTFGALPKRAGAPEPAGSRVERFPTPGAQPVVLHHTGRSDQAIAEVSWPTTDEHAAWTDIAPTAIMAEILRQRVTDRLRTAEGLTYTPRGGAEFSRVFPGWGRVSLAVDCKPEDIPKVYAEIDAMAADLAATPVTDDELQRVLRPALQLAKREQQQIGYWTTQLAGAQTNPDRLDYARQTMPRLSAVTAADVQRVAKRWLKPGREFRIEVTPAPGAPTSKVAAG